MPHKEAVRPRGTLGRAVRPGGEGGIAERGAGATPSDPVTPTQRHVLGFGCAGPCESSKNLTNVPIWFGEKVIPINIPKACQRPYEAAQSEAAESFAAATPDATSRR